MPTQRLVFVGSKAAGLAVLERVRERVAAIVTFDDRDDPRSVFPAFVDLAHTAEKPLKVVERSTAEHEILACEPDLVLVCGWYWLFSSHFLQSVPGGVLGIHNSLLPAYRGGAPVVWAMIRGEARIGTSLFYMSEGMDDGMIVAQRSVAVGEHDQVGDVLAHLERLISEMVADNLAALLDGSAPKVPQDESQASYCAQRRPEDGRIDWTWSAQRVHDFIRAQAQPYPGAWTHFEGSKLTLWRSRLLREPHYGAPGQILRLLPEGPAVCCSDGRALLITLVQRDAGPIPARTVFRSISPRLG